MALYSRPVSGPHYPTLTPMFYQMSCIYAALVLCTLAYLEERGEGNFRLICREFLYLLAALLGGILNYLTGPWLDRILTQKLHYDIIPSKQLQGGSFQWIIKNLMGQFKDMYESSLGLMMPLRIPFLFSSLITALVIILIIKSEEKGRLWVYLLYKAVSFAFMCSMQVVSTPGAFTCRVIAPFYTMQAMNVLIALFWLHRSQKQREPAGKTLGACKGFPHSMLRKVAVLTTVYVLTQYFFIQIIIANRVLSENLDILYA